MQFFTPLRHGKGLPTLVATVIAVLVILVIFPFLTFAGQPVLPSLALRALISLLLLVGWGLYYALRFGTLMMADEHQLSALKASRLHRLYLKQQKRQINRWLRALRSHPAWCFWRIPDPESYYLLLNANASIDSRVAMQIWPSLAAEPAQWGQFKAYRGEGIRVIETPLADHESELASTWRNVVHQLRRLRTKTAVQGVVVALAAEDVQSGSRHQAVASMLHQLSSLMQARVPVYLVVDHLQSVPGFDEFAGSLSQAEQQQLFGVTLPADSALSRSQCLADQFRELQQRVDALLSNCLYQERQLEQRKELLRFPVKFEQLTELVLDAFGVIMPTGSSMLLRGVYFVGQRKFEYPVEAETSSKGRTTVFQTFASAIWPSVLEQDQGLAVPGNRWQRRQWATRVLVGGLCMAAFVGAGSWQIYSYGQSQGSLDQLQSTISRHQATLEQAPQTSERQVISLLQIWLETIQKVQEDVAPSWPGLSVTSELEDPLNRYRLKLHRDSVLPILRDRAQMLLRSSETSAEERLTALKIYLMLAEPERRDLAMMSQWFAEHVSADTQNAQIANSWLEARADEALRAHTDAIAVDQELIGLVRANLNQIPREQQLYLRIKQAARYRGLTDFQYAGSVGYQVNDVFDGGFFTVPGLYTVKGYAQVFEPELNHLLAEYEEERWVLGTEAILTEEEDLPKLRAAVRRAYSDDYIRYWQTALSQLKLVRIQSLDQAMSIFGVLTGAASPLQSVLENTAEQTSYSFADSGAEAADKLQEAAKVVGGKSAMLASKLDKAKRAAGSLDADIRFADPFAAIRERFHDLNQLVRKSGSEDTPLKHLVVELNGTQQFLGAVTMGYSREALFKTTLGRFQNGGADALGQMRLTGRQLPEPLRSWVSDLGDQVWSLMLADTQTYIQDAYDAEIKSYYREHLDQRFPLISGARQDISYEHFSEYFRPQGVEEQFFDEYVQPFVDAGRGRWQLRKVDGRGIPFTTVALQQFNRAQRIRSGLFGGKPAFHIRMSMKPIYLDANVSRFELRLDDQRLNYRHGPQRPINVEWPASTSTPGLSVAFEDYNGLVSKRSADGNWALFRMLEQFDVQSEQSGGPYQLSYELEGRRIVYAVQGGSDLNIVMTKDIQQYRLPALFNG